MTLILTLIKNNFIFIGLQNSSKWVYTKKEQERH